MNTPSPSAPNTGTLRHGLKIGETVHKDFELRRLESGHFFDAEDMADETKPIKFQTAMLCQQLVRIGSYTGPFTLELMRQIRPGDIKAMQDVRLLFNAVGEDAQLD